ncbi:hypothetical protein GQ55_3G049200 [Panicum hallii var. hallii]|uniref:Uncharacterized protein n=2 Tax=Panicum hallii TaxID=206008 RepID=A0A2T7E5U1_9POAL|nr:uncharacterized protein LOC112886290 [Panicum hallii]PAN16291.1 hypothetical protein PAHAL_3G051400 [Panicum hallii]PUZ63201.1 hypothetical protein GQ55_3G049200 [Panicum hallii var. hallii]
MAPLEAVATTTMSSRVEAAGRMPSMEWEPKTLTLDQIKFAREAALYVVSTKTEEEAIRIFTEGLKPVEVTVRKSNSFDSSSDDDVDLGCSSDSTKQARGGGSKGGARGGHRGCRRRSIDIERDVTTAPF